MVRGQDLDALQLDQSRWGEYTPGDGEDDSDYEPEADDDDDDEGAGMEVLGVLRRRMTGRGTAASKAHQKPMAIVPKQPGSSKFRAAVDVINRLQWDDSLDSSDYMVGYEDRFTGAREKALEQWKTEQTDDEFIPQHRILYFRRKSDGVVVWERRSRIDGIFDSGVKAEVDATAIDSG